MALTVATYAFAGPWWAQRLIGVAAVIALATLNYRGITKTVVLTYLLVSVTLIALGVVIGAVWFSADTNLNRVAGWQHVGVHGALQSAGLLFFAFAGYARVATLGEEVRNPERTIPRARCRSRSSPYWSFMPRSRLACWRFPARTRWRRALRRCRMRSGPLVPARLR
jgi:basic amino acid/polyamine antiporter, APA family